MKMQEIKSMAMSMGIKALNLKKPELLRAIQRAEGNIDCFGRVNPAQCDQSGCLWKKDCMIAV